MFVGYKNGYKLFDHNGINYSYYMNFYCVPENEEIYTMIYNFKPKYISKEELTNEIKKYY
jgi:hypothetical protein